MQPAGQKCQLKHGRETNGVSHVYQTCQANAKKGHLKAKNASKNMTGRRKLPIEQSIYLSTYLSIYASIHASIHLCLYLSIHPSIYVSLPISLSPYLSIYLSIDRSIYLYIYPCIHPSINPSIYVSLSISLSIYQTCLSIYLSICPYIRISIYHLSIIHRYIYPSIYRSI